MCDSTSLDLRCITSGNRSSQAMSFLSFEHNFADSKQMFFLLFFSRFYRQFFLFLFYFLFSLVCFTLRPGPPPKQAPTTPPPLNKTAINITASTPNSTFPHVSSQLGLTDILLHDPNSSLKLYSQYRSPTRNMPLPYRLISSSNYTDKIYESVTSKNVTLDSETGSVMAYQLGDLHNGSSSNRTQLSVSKTLNISGTSSRGEQDAEEKRKRARKERDSESLSQVNRRMRIDD